MSHPQIAWLLTASYWAVAALFAMLAPRVDWIDLRWPVAIYFFAIPTTIILWLVVIGVRFLAPAFSRSRFALIGVGVPVIYLAVVAGGGHWLAEVRERGLEEQLRASSLVTFDDEPLVIAGGPIGVRVRYQVAYPRGLDLDADHAAFAQFITAPSRGGWAMTRRVVTPRVSGHLAAGTYEITEDFVPAFLPPSQRFGTSGPGGSDACFHWPAGVSREQILEQDPAPLEVAIYLAHSPIQRTTRHSYRLADFHATATREGAVDCVR